MIDVKTIYRVHKWLAVVVAAVTLGWFASGALMTLPERWLTLSPSVSTDYLAEATLPGAPDFADARVAPVDAIAAVRAHVRTPVRVTAVRLRRLPQHIAFEVTTDRRGTHLVDAVSGAVFGVDEMLARQIVARFLQQDERSVRMSYRGGGGHRFDVADRKGTTFYVDAATGQAVATDHLKRVARTIGSLHSLAPLRIVLPDAGVRIVMLVMASTGVLMAAAGIVILLVQLERWRRRGRSVATI
jgi:hypothetical protein